MYDTIIVPLEGSLHCERAVSVARDEGGRHNAAIVLLHVIPRPERPVPDPRVICSGPRINAADWPDDKATKATCVGQTYLEDVRRRHFLPEGTTSRVVIGEPVKRILAEARRWPAPLIIMTAGEAAGAGLTHSTLSEVMRRVLVHGEVPVMAVHAPLQENSVSAATLRETSSHAGGFALV